MQKRRLRDAMSHAVDDRKMHDFVQDECRRAYSEARREHEPVTHSDNDNESDNRCRNTTGEEVFDLEVALSSALVFHHDGSYDTLDSL